MSHEPPLVIVLHGLGHTRHYMSLLSWRLGRNGFRVVNHSYPSRRGNLLDHAEALASALKPFSSERLHFVTHSLGGIVVRKFAATYHTDFNLGRLVMLGPPNQGSAFARGLLNFPPRKFLWGPVFDELAYLEVPASTELLEVGVIAGAFPLRPWPFLKGAHDGIVSVEETKLAGAKDHVTVTDVHASLPFNPRTFHLTKRFLQTGRFA